MAWPKGVARPNGKTPGSGRKVGSLNKRSGEAREVAASIIDHPEVQAQWLEQALAGTLSPVILQTLMYYCWGKPVERLEHTGDVDNPLVILFRRGADE